MKSPVSLDNVAKDPNLVRLKLLNCIMLFSRACKHRSGYTSVIRVILALFTTAAPIRNISDEKKKLCEVLFTSLQFVTRFDESIAAESAFH